MARPCLFMIDPTLPLTGANATSAVLRGQFNILRALIDAIQTLNNAAVDAVNTLPAGDAAGVSVSVVGDTLHFVFDIPQGEPGAEGPQWETGLEGPAGEPGSPEGPQGEQGEQVLPGEVSLAELEAAIAGTSGNSDGVEVLGMVVSDPPSQGEMQAIVD